MTLKQKREIVRDFLNGEGLSPMAVERFEYKTTGLTRYERCEAVIRDYLNGKFTLEPKKLLPPPTRKRDGR